MFDRDLLLITLKMFSSRFKGRSSELISHLNNLEPVSMYICAFICLCVCLTVCLMCVSVCLSLCVCLSFFLSICLSMFLCLSVSVSLSLCISFFVCLSFLLFFLPDSYTEQFILSEFCKNGI